jgi:signal transduction histidine kinase/outer membrane murein-binding lipoprotein Lpp
MRFRTWPVAAVALGGLLLLVAVSLQASSRKAQEIYSQLEQLNAHHRDVDTKLRRLRSDVHLSSIFMRDYLLDTARERAAEYRARLSEYRRNNMATLGNLRALTAGGAGHETRVQSLQLKLDEYWRAFDPLFDWTPAQKISRSASFLRREVLPRREAVMSIALEIEELNNANLNIQGAEVMLRHAAFRADLHALLWQSLLLGVVVAITAVIRLRVLERRSEVERAAAQDAESQMRQLSQQVVATQEEERKKLSRELHDQVGQMLTVLRMELGRIDRLRSSGDGLVAGAVAECRQLVDNVFRTVRDLALGLRPSMLDDFGLQPALEWQVRDFGRRYGVPVALSVHGNLDDVSEQHRTCVYRAVQEALTNCVRHARANRIEVALTYLTDALIVSVADNGVGFDPAVRAGGLGLRGIEERVRELQGTMSITSSTDVGTILTVRLPAPTRLLEVAHARAAS